MKESIYTIPISEVFEPKDGCPLCRLKGILQERCLQYIMGAAMMEPDIRIQTNEAGFCDSHYKSMLGMGNRLSLALMLESHLQWVQENDFAPVKARGKMFGGKKEPDAPKKRCYVCEEVDKVMSTMLNNTIVRWGKDPDFRALYDKQPYICREHYHALVALAPKALGAKAPEFVKATADLSQKYLAVLMKDVTHFCRMHDYRNRGQDWGESRDAVERAIQYLTGYRQNKDE